MTKWPHGAGSVAAAWSMGLGLVGCASDESSDRGDRIPPCDDTTAPVCSVTMASLDSDAVGALERSVGLDEDVDAELVAGACGAGGNGPDRLTWKLCRLTLDDDRQVVVGRSIEPGVVVRARVNEEPVAFPLATDPGSALLLAAPSVSFVILDAQGTELGSVSGPAHEASDLSQPPAPEIDLASCEGLEVCTISSVTVTGSAILSHNGLTDATAIVGTNSEVGFRPTDEMLDLGRRTWLEIPARDAAIDPVRNDQPTETALERESVSLLVPPPLALGEAAAEPATRFVVSPADFHVDGDVRPVWIALAGFQGTGDDIDFVGACAELQNAQLTLLQAERTHLTREQVLVESVRLGSEPNSPLMAVDNQDLLTALDP